MKKYYGLDWLRAFSCIGVMCLHMAANNDYVITGFIYQRMIPSFNFFVFLLMSVSAFGMCCGYYDKTLSGQINWTEFYKRRYIKILPFFSVLVFLDLIINFSVNSVYEAFTELTLLHGFIPNEITVIGVGWTLGTIFIFYLIFPFFCVLIENRKRAWFSFAISIILNYICSVYFAASRNNFVLSLCYFILGGLIYLYREEIPKIKFYFSALMVAVSVACYFFADKSIFLVFVRLFAIASIMVLAVSVDCKPVRPVAYISSISMEFYLSHMVIFRGIEKLHLNTVFGNGWTQYLFTVVSVGCGTVVFSTVMQKIIRMCNFG